MEYLSLDITNDQDNDKIEFDWNISKTLGKEL